MKDVTVSSADIARLAGVRPTAVSNWRRRYENFPEPVGGTGKSPRFALADVTTWLQAQRKAVPLPTDETLWQAFESARESASITTTLAIVGLFLFHHAQHTDTEVQPDGAGWRALLVRARADLVRDHPGVPEIALDYSIDPRLRALLEAADVAVRESNPTDLYENLCERVFKQDIRSGIPATPMPLAALMIDLTDIGDGTVLDPACGAGNVLMAADRASRTTLLGQELDASLVLVTAVRLALSSFHPDVMLSLRAGNTLTDNGFASVCSAAVICDPPFNDRGWGHDALARDPRWVYGAPPGRESELAWAQHALAHTTEDGTAVVVMPPTTATRPSGRRIRAELVRQGALRAVIALSIGHTNSQNLWVLRHPGAGTPDTVLMVDATAAKDADWAETRKLVIGSWWPYQSDPSGFVDVLGKARAVPRIEILDEEVNLTPAWHITQPRGPIKTTAEIEHDRGALAEELSELGQTLPGPPSVAAPPSSQVRWATVDELIELGIVRLLRNRSRDSDDEKIDSRVLSGEDIATDSPPSETAHVSADELRAPVVRFGDILIPQIAQRLTVRVAREDDLGARIARSALLLRADRDSIDPWYLTGFLAGEEANQQVSQLSSSMGGRYLLAIRQLRVPLPDIEIQRQYGQQVRLLFEHRRRLRRAVEQVDKYRIVQLNRLTALIAGEDTDRITRGN